MPLESGWFGPVSAGVQSDMSIQRPDFVNTLTGLSNDSVIATTIQKMHDQDPSVYPFQDWDSPKGPDVRSTTSVWST